MPNGERATIDPQKLIDYCLNPDHDLGKHKAKLFLQIIGIGRSDWILLRDEPLRAAISDAADLVGADVHGERYRIDFEMIGSGRSAIIRSIWIIRTGEPDPPARDLLYNVRKRIVMGRSPKTLDIVAVLSTPESGAVEVGDVGTVVEELGAGAVEVEFLDASGRTRCVKPMSMSDLLVLNRERMPIG